MTRVGGDILGMNNEGHIWQGFVRQRRNLMIVSLVLLFVEAAELTINEVNVFGNRLVLKNPAIVTYALWIGFAYWLWRYSVYFHDLGDKGFLRAYHERMLYLVQRIAFRQAKRDREIMDNLVKEGKTKLVLIGSPNFARYYHRSPLRYVIGLQLHAYSTTNKDEPPKEISRDRYVVDARGPMLVANIRAWMHALMIRHMFSEYIVPLAVAALPILYGLYTLFTDGAPGA